MKRFIAGLWFAAWLIVAACAGGAETGLRLGTFDVDATPPVGSMMAYDKVAARTGGRCVTTPNNAIEATKNTSAWSA